MTLFRETAAAERFFDLRDELLDRVGAVNRAEAGGLEPTDSTSPTVPDPEPSPEVKPVSDGDR